MTDTQTIDHKKQYLEKKQFFISEAVLHDTEGIYTARLYPGLDQPLHRFHATISQSEYHKLKKEVVSALNLFGQEPYRFERPDAWFDMSFSQQDEYRFTDQLNKTGLTPVYNTNTQHYNIPKPMDLVLSSPEYSTVYFSSLFPPTVVGDEYDSIEGFEGSIDCRLLLMDNGRVYMAAKNLNVFPPIEDNFL